MKARLVKADSRVLVEARNELVDAVSNSLNVFDSLTEEDIQDLKNAEEKAKALGLQLNSKAEARKAAAYDTIAAVYGAKHVDRMLRAVQDNSMLNLSYGAIMTCPNCGKYGSLAAMKVKGGYAMKCKKCRKVFGNVHKHLNDVVHKFADTWAALLETESEDELKAALEPYMQAFEPAKIDSEKGEDQKHGK